MIALALGTVTVASLWLTSWALEPRPVGDAVAPDPAIHRDAVIQARDGAALLNPAVHGARAYPHRRSALDRRSRRRAAGPFRLAPGRAARLEGLGCGVSDLIDTTEMYLKTIFELEADRLQNLAIDPDVVESERNVVYSERRLRIDNDNQGRLYEQMLANAFVAHPYQFPVIGWPSDIENWTQYVLK